MSEANSITVTPVTINSAPDLVHHVTVQFDAWLATKPSGDQGFACQFATGALTASECTDVVCAFARSGFHVESTITPHGDAGLRITHTAARLLRTKKIQAKAAARPTFVWTIERDDKLRADRAAGKQFRAIAEELGVSMARAKDRYAQIRNRQPGTPGPASCSRQE